VDKGITLLWLLASSIDRRVDLQSGHKNRNSGKCLANVAIHTHSELQAPKALVPLTHAAAALAKADAGVLHAPQWAVAELRSTSQPLLALPSQLPNLHTKSPRVETKCSLPPGACVVNDMQTAQPSFSPCLHSRNMGEAWTVHLHMASLNWTGAPLTQGGSC
jgi:hypothetical protein